MPSALALILNLIWLIYLFWGATLYLVRQPTSALNLATPIGRIIYELKPALAVLCVVFEVLLSRAVATSLRNFSSCALSPRSGMGSLSGAEESPLEQGNPNLNCDLDAKPADWPTLVCKICDFLQVSIICPWIVGSSAFQLFKEGVAWPQTGQIQDDVVAVVVYAFHGVVNCSVVLGIGCGLYVGAKHTIAIVRGAESPEISDGKPPRFMEGTEKVEN